MIKTTFNKPPLSLNQQISLLKKRNLIITILKNIKISNNWLYLIEIKRRRDESEI